jgi:hypothetical protein
LRPWRLAISFSGFFSKRRRLDAIIDTDGALVKLT